MAHARIGEVPERLNGTVSKTVVGLVPTVGSNPTLSALLDCFVGFGFSKTKSHE